MPQLSMFRAYTPELVGWFDDFGPSSGFNDALGGIGRIGTTLNAFSPSLPPGIPDLTQPLDATGLLASFDTGNHRRCPGANERPAADLGDDSVPFTDGGALTDGIPGECDPSVGIPGP
jgi:hypothetical protein